jgi:hypothetical protein
LRRRRSARLVCADHPNKPMEHDGCGAEGARCQCNPDGVVPWHHVYAGEVDPREERPEPH